MSGMSPAQALIAAMLTPALLILASGSLIATALVRLARVVDRVRSLAAAPAEVAPVDDLRRHERRARFATLAINAYFVAVALFVLAGAAIAADHLANGRLTLLPIALTLTGMLLIVVGAGAMTLESRDSAALIAADIDRLRRRSASLSSTAS
jgi:hypothetical protein